MANNLFSETDYMPGTYMVLFLPNVTEANLNISVFEDLIRERDESFILTITGRTQPGRVKIGQRKQTTVTIADTSGKLLMCINIL